MREMIRRTSGAWCIGIASLLLTLLASSGCNDKTPSVAQGGILVFDVGACLGRAAETPIAVKSCRQLIDRFYLSVEEGRQGCLISQAVKSSQRAARPILWSGGH